MFGAVPTATNEIAKFLRYFPKLQDTSGLQEPLLEPEVIAAVASLPSNTTVGAYGVSAKLLKLICKQKINVKFITIMLTSIMGDQCPLDLLVSQLTPIPKPKKVATNAANLRPLVVTSIWYCILAKIFVARLG